MTTEEKQRLLLLGYARDRFRYNDSFYEFFKDAWKAVDPYNELQSNWHIKYFCFIAQLIADRIVNNEDSLYRQVLINVPPRSLKSWVFNICLPVYVWTKKPTLPMITTSYSLDLGLGFSRKAQQIINSNWFQYRYSDIVKIGLSEGGRESAQETETSAGGIRYVASTDSTIVGKGFLLGIVDDPIKPTEATSAISLDKNIRFYNESFDTRRNNPKTSVAIIIMQRVSEGDLSGYLIETYGQDDNFLHINLPAVADGTEKVPFKEEFLLKHPEEEGNIYKNNYLFGDRFDDTFIKQQKKKSSIFWATQFQQNPLPTDGLVFKRDWVSKISLEEYLKLERTHNLKRTFVCDTAFTDQTKNDASAILTYAEHGGITYVINAQTNHVDSADLPKYIENYVKRNGYNERRSIITIEPKSSGMVIISLLKKLTNLNVIPYKYPASAKVNVNMSKLMRAESVVALVESGKLVLVDGLWNEELLQQLTTFPLSKRDDLTDVVVMGLLRSHYIDSRYKKFVLKRSPLDK